MDLIDRIHELAARVPDLVEHLETEEATKNALVMPFIIGVLEYDVFDPTEVIPEFTADVGMKKGEKVDYAIMRNGEPIILFECKRYGADLERGQASQLYRYFNVTNARFGVLTDGVRYQFFSDLDQPNIMDNRPFLEFSLRDFEDALVDELKKFTKPSFDLEEILTTASDLMYTKRSDASLSSSGPLQTTSLLASSCRGCIRDTKRRDRSWTDFGKLRGGHCSSSSVTGSTSG
jgi:predicted type IV restriction endonuclease